MIQQTFKYIISYGGGIGPDVWDKEMIITAPDILTALKIAYRQLEIDYFNDCQIFAIEQED
jgi:hypothetical protein